MIRFVKRFLTSAVLCFCLASAAYAQTGVTTSVRSAGTLPSTCKASNGTLPAQMIVVSSVLYLCGPTDNAWTAVGNGTVSGASGEVAVFSGPNSVGGASGFTYSGSGMLFTASNPSITTKAFDFETTSNAGVPVYGIFNKTTETLTSFYSTNYGIIGGVNEVVFTGSSPGSTVNGNAYDGLIFASSATQTFPELSLYSGSITINTSYPPTVLDFMHIPNMNLQNHPAGTTNAGILIDSQTAGANVYAIKTGTGPVNFGDTVTATGLVDSGITGSTQCVHANSSGAFSGTGSDCPSFGGAANFTTLAVATDIQLAEIGAPSGISSTSVIWANSANHWLDFNPNNAGTLRVAGISGTVVSGHCLQFNDTVGTVIDSGGGCGSTLGTVTSVALTVPAWLSVSGSPITSSGTLAVTAATGQTSHQVIGTGSGSSFGAVTLATGDLPYTYGGSTTELGTVTGSLTSGHCVKIDASGNFIDATAACGTVTSVAESFTGGLISVGGSPITSSGTLALTVAGTSGGVPYFSSSSTWASSAALTANLPVIGGGAGSAPTVGTRSGNTTKFVTTTGSLVNGDCVSIDVSGNFIDSGQAGCGGGGAGGTVTSVGLAGPTGFTISGSPVATSGTLTFAMPSGWTTGDLLLGNGSNSVARLAIGTNGQVLQSNGTTASWITLGTGGTVTSVGMNNITTASQNLATCATANSGTTPLITCTLSSAPAHKFFMNNSGSGNTPDFETAGEGDLPATTVFTDKANTFGAFLNDFSAGTIRLPVASGFTTTTNGNIGYDTTNNNWHARDNAADKIVAIWNSTPTNGDCAIANITSGAITLTATSACTGAAIQTDGTPNTSQAVLNFTDTSGGTGILWSNPSGGVESAQLASSAGGGNAVLLGTLTGMSQGDFICANSSNVLVNCVSGVVVNTQVGTTYTIAGGDGGSSDRGKLVTFNNSSAVAVTLPQAGSTGFGSNIMLAVKNIGTGAVTITPTTSTIDGNATLVLLTGQGATLFSDNSNYYSLTRGSPSGTTGSVSGALTVGTCDSGTATVNGATTSMVATASPATYPGDGLYWVAYVSATNTVTVKECSTATITPTATVFNVRVIP